MKSTTQALQKLYEKITGEKTTENTRAEIIEQLAEKWEGGGGGGSSDFSTAEVTITKAEGKIVIWPFPTIISDRLVVNKYFQQELTETHPVALYKGALEINIGPGVFSIISGNVTEDDGVFTITGDCSLQYIGF